ncbi:hypothetical protein L484_016812 [Morus notabilis]|uniref:Uncharacterized protein n=1 Tax=Morus notabilis TaxID=981085 RepID=W9S4G9_9ROSA|nr:hypothetical protein L484_016812 [Morus notabilis]
MFKYLLLDNANGAMLIIELLMHQVSPYGRNLESDISIETYTLQLQHGIKLTKNKVTDSYPERKMCDPLQVFYL